MEHQHHYVFVLDTYNMTTSGLPFVACKYCGQFLNLTAITYEVFIKNIQEYHKKTEN